MISLSSPRAPIAPACRSDVRDPFEPQVHTKEVAVNDTRSERIAKAEEGLAEMQTVLDHAKRAVEAADRAERAAHQAAQHARSFAKAITVVVGSLAVVALIAALTRRRHR
jgi:Flp pilus assembly protein TadB